MRLTSQVDRPVVLRSEQSEHLPDQVDLSTEQLAVCELVLVQTLVVLLVLLAGILVIVVLRLS